MSSKRVTAPSLFTTKIWFRILSNPSGTSFEIMNHHRASRRTFIKTTALAMPFIASGCAHLATGSKRGDDFVCVRNGQFQLRGQPYFYVGRSEERRVGKE